MQNLKAIVSREARKASRIIPGASQRERYGKAGRAVEKQRSDNDKEKR